MVWLVAAISLAALAAAGVLAVTGGWQEAAKTALFGLLFPGGVLFGWWGLRLVRRPRLVERAVGVGLLGVAVWVATLLIWLPFSPWRWEIEDMPLVLRVPFIGGLTLGIGLMAVASAAQVRELWRRRKYLDVVLFLAIVGFGVLAVVMARLQAD
jgi:multisubunit Na+/H+ antiporter MnhF subunit